MSYIVLRKGDYFITPGLEIIGEVYDVHKYYGTVGISQTRHAVMLKRNIPLDEAKEYIEKRLRQDES